MRSFRDVLGDIRIEKPEIFDMRALEEGQDRYQDSTSMEVVEVQIPTDKNIWGTKDRTEEPNNDIVQYPSEPLQEPFGGMEPEQGAFDSNRRRYGINPVDVELLAIYRPFHYYPHGEWGILFFERNMLEFCSRFFSSFSSLGYSKQQTQKMITYAVARHEFFHYLFELICFQLEMSKGGQIYIPYHEHVYQPIYPNDKCIEETVAQVSFWDNGVMRSSAKLQQMWRNVVQRSSEPAYRNGGDYDQETIEDKVNELFAQANYCSINPRIINPVWGLLPHPYVQPWTRYENVEFMMTRSGGGNLASLLNAGPIKKTMRIYHI